MFDVHLCGTPAEHAAVRRLRYEIYVEEMGRPQPHADHERREIGEELDQHSWILGIRADGALAGTLRLNRVDRGIGKYEQLYRLADLDADARRRTVIVTALMLRPSVRGVGAMGMLFRAIYSQARSMGVDTCWIDCNEPLVPMFERWGFVSQGPLHHPLYGQVRLMRLDLLDRDHLAAVSSPFAKIVDDPSPHLPRISRMTTMDRLRADFSCIAEPFNASPAVARLRRGEATVAEYASLMTAIAQQARENPQIQAYATAFFRGHQRELVGLFCKHAVSEIGHDQLASDDVATLGYATDGLFKQQPLPTTIALTAYAYYTISHIGPVSYLGYLFFLEFLPTAFGAEYLQALDAIGVHADARTFIQDHATIDVGHNKLMERYVDQLITNEDEYESVRFAMEVTGKLYANMVEEAFARADRVGTLRELAPAERTLRPKASPHAEA
jgi:predicted GNAT family N-acyltransferase